MLACVTITSVHIYRANKHFSVEEPANLTTTSRLYMDGDTPQRSCMEYFFLTWI